MTTPSVSNDPPEARGDAAAARRQDRKSVKAGDLAPDFTLADAATGQARTLSEFARGRDTLVVFFRGTWCPFCRVQMDVLRDSFARLEAADVALVGVVCQKPGSVRAFLDRNPLPFPLLCDERRETARAYGTHYWLTAEGFNLSHPALFILDAGRRATFAHVGRNMRDLPVSVVLERFLGFLESDPGATD